MKPKKYNEFSVQVRNGKADLSTKQPTKRGFVMIDDRTAEVNNQRAHQFRLYYELAKEDGDDEALRLAKEEADKLGVQYPKNIGLENLLKKIETFKER